MKFFRKINLVVALSIILGALPENVLFGMDYTRQLEILTFGNGLLYSSTYERPISALALGVDNNLLALGFDDGTILLVDLIKCNILTNLFIDDGAIFSLCFSKNGNLLASMHSSGIINVWNLDSRTISETLQNLKCPFPLHDFSESGKILAFGNYDENIGLWNLETKRFVCISSNSSNPISSIVFNPSETLVALEYTDGTINLWDTNSGIHAGTLVGYNDSICPIAFGSDGILLGSKSKNGQIKLWDLGSWNIVRKMDNPNSYFWMLPIEHSTYQNPNFLDHFVKSYRNENGLAESKIIGQHTVLVAVGFSNGSFCIYKNARFTSVQNFSGSLAKL